MSLLLSVSARPSDCPSICQHSDCNFVKLMMVNYAFHLPADSTQSCFLFFLPLCLTQSDGQSVCLSGFVSVCVCRCQLLSVILNRYLPILETPSLHLLHTVPCHLSTLETEASTAYQAFRTKLDQTLIPRQN